MARVGRLTSLPCRPLGPLSSISSVPMRRAKSQAATPAMRGASILPLKQRRAGRSAPLPRRSAPAARRRRRDRPPSCSPRPRRRRRRRASRAAGRRASCRSRDRPWPTRDTRRDAQLLAGDDARAAAFSAMPSGVSTSAKPAPVRGIAARITVCGPSSAGSARSAPRRRAHRGSVASLAPSISA